MSVRKFRSVEDIPAPPARTPLDPDNLRIACELSELARALHPRRLEAGLKKFHSVGQIQPRHDRLD